MVVAMLVAGCGAYPWGSGTAVNDSSPSNDAATRLPAGQPDELTKLVVLDWSGGYAEIASRWLSGADFAQLYLASGETLEADAASLEESVRARTEEILSVLGPARFVVVVDEAGNHPDATVVYFTAEAIAGDRYQVGQTKLDQCDLREDATVIVWIGTLLKLGNEHAYEEWVNALANTAAHEVGHTVGFFHPDAESNDFTEYEKNAEIMMGVHTLSALLGRQQFLIPQETCPESIADQFGGIAYELSATSTARPPALTYKTADSHEMVTCDSASEPRP